MMTPLKLNSIDQEHLQELYDGAGVARDELPYTPVFDSIVQGFQDRTFKNATHEQLFSAILKYVRSSSNAAAEPVAGLTPLTEEQVKQLKVVVSRHGSAGKLLPYSDAFNSARTEFNKLASASFSEQEFWHSLQRANGTRRKPPVAKRAKAAVPADDDEDGE
ncbi:MAG TPA: hypothetical protein VFE47_03965 [Tepidisphaeraceae bacterium]|jgi:hypothetical protein|nr:hypothetical protein [Tepidisphaeraceae bacterium]